MTQTEFIEANDKLERYYEKAYTPEQNKIMFEVLKDWSIEKYRKAVMYCLGNCKFLPKIADIKKAGMEEKISTSREKVEFEKTKCSKCNDGFIKYFKKVDGTSYEYIALCTCQNGRKQKELNGFNLPFINEIGL